MFKHAYLGTHHIPGMFAKYSRLVGIEVLSICITTCVFTTPSGVQVAGVNSENTSRLFPYSQTREIIQHLQLCSRIGKLDRSYNIFNYFPVLTN